MCTLHLVVNDIVGFMREAKQVNYMSQYTMHVVLEYIRSVLSNKSENLRSTDLDKSEAKFSGKKCPELRNYFNLCYTIKLINKLIKS